MDFFLQLTRIFQLTVVHTPCYRLHRKKNTQNYVLNYYKEFKPFEVCFWSFFCCCGWFWDSAEDVAAVFSPDLPVTWRGTAVTNPTAGKGTCLTKIQKEKCSGILVPSSTDGCIPFKEKISELYIPKITLIIPYELFTSKIMPMVNRTSLVTSNDPQLRVPV